MNNIHDKLTQYYANNIINQTPDNKQETGVSNILSTGHYLKADAQHFPSTNMGPPIHVVFLNFPNHAINQTMFTIFSSLN